METYTFLIVLGLLMAIGFIGIGVLIGRINNDYCDDGCPCCGNGDRCSNNGPDKQPEEVILGLQAVRSRLSGQEKEYLDYAVDCVYRIGQLRQMIAERSK